eukprot:2599180-Rhodomonas_salina.2
MAADGFSFGSTTGNWDRMARFAREHKMLFIPSVGPGYDDSKIRPWNRQNMSVCILFCDDDAFLSLSVVAQNAVGEWLT